MAPAGGIENRLANAPSLLWKGSASFLNAVILSEGTIERGSGIKVGKAVWPSSPAHDTLRSTGAGCCQVHFARGQQPAFSTSQQVLAEILNMLMNNDPLSFE